MDRAIKYEKALDRLRELLALDRPGKDRTASSLAKRLRVSKPTIYSRIDALEARGVAVKRQSVRRGGRGPLAVAFGV